MNKVTQALALILKPYAIPYQESTVAFEIFGLDFMVDDQLNVFLIELNDKVGYYPTGGIRDKRFINFNKKYLEWVYSNAIEPIIKNVHKK